MKIISNWCLVRHPKFHLNEVISWGEAGLKGKGIYIEDDQMGSKVQIGISERFL